MNGLKIVGMGRGLPVKHITNDDLAQIVDTNDEWIRKRTGISARYYCTENESNTTLAYDAVVEAMRSAGISASQVGLCLAATVTPDYAVPCVACRIQEQVGLPDGIPCFDINAACSGFLYGLHLLSCMPVDEERPFALLIGVEELSRVTDMSDRSTCVLFGDGAACAVVKLKKDGEFYSHIGARGNTEILNIPGLNKGMSYIHMSGREVFTFAVDIVEKEIERLEEESNYSLSDMDFVVLHQANERIIRHIQKKRDIPEEKLIVNIGYLGNTSAASVPLALYELWKAGRLSTGKKIFTAGFGGGLTWGSAVLEF